MYQVWGRWANVLEIYIKEDEDLQTVSVDDGVRMDWTGRRDWKGNDIYEFDIVRHIITKECCEIQKLNDGVENAEGMRCLVTETGCIDGRGLPYDMSMYERIGDTFTTPELRVVKE